MEEYLPSLIVACFFAGVLIALKFDDIAARISPKYGVRRAIRSEKASQRRIDKYNQKRARKQDRLQEWAHAHADDPVAQDYLGLVVDEAASFDPAEKIRREQAVADQLVRDEEIRQQQRRHEIQLKLEWALAHPDDPTARRYLVERFKTLQSDLEQANDSIRVWDPKSITPEDKNPNWERQMGYYNDAVQKRQDIYEESAKMGRPLEPVTVDDE